MTNNIRTDLNDTVPIVGGLYGSRDPDDTYRVVKVLAVDDSAVHIRMYAERFVTMPIGVTSSQLTLGSPSSPGGLGVGHLPVSREGFLREPRTLLSTEAVGGEELEGYRYWAGEDCS
jgi:hypothetical protein